MLMDRGVCEACSFNDVLPLDGDRMDVDEDGVAWGLGEEILVEGERVNETGMDEGRGLSEGEGEAEADEEAEVGRAPVLVDATVTDALG